MVFNLQNNKMTIENFIELRDFCRDMKCPVVLNLDSLEKASKEYNELIRKNCHECFYNAWQYHNWLQKKRCKILIPRNSH